MVYAGGERRLRDDMGRERRRDAVAIADPKDNWPACRDWRAEEPVKGAVRGVDAGATRSRVRLDVRRTRRGTIEPGVRPRNRPGQRQLQRRE